MRTNRQGWHLAAFFIFYFVVLQLVSDLQYYLEYGDDIADTLKYRALVTPISVLPYLLFYLMVIPLLLEKKYWRFLFSVIVFIGFLEIFLHLLDWMIWHLPLLSRATRIRGKFNWEQVRFPRQSIWLTFVHLAALSGFGYFMNRRQEEKIMQQLREDHMRLQLDALKSQLHPHFFFNTLNNIYSLALYRSEKTAAVVEQLSELMRYIIYDGSKTTVLLEKEIGFLEHYAALEKIRHDEKARIGFEWQGEAGKLELAPLLFMPLMENAFKHGFKDPNQPGWLEAILIISGRELMFQVRNSSTAAQVSTGTGIGLSNLRQRLQLLYPGAHELSVTETASVFEARLNLKLA